MFQITFGAQRVRNHSGQFFDGVRSICPHVKDAVSRRGIIDTFGDDRSHVVDVGEGPLLSAITEDGHRFPAQQLIHEDTNHIPVAISDVLPFAIDVVRAEDYVIEAEHLVTDPQFLLHSEFRNSVRILRYRDHVL